MSYPVKVHIRHSTVLVIVVLLMGSVLYEVTRTESVPSSAARTQDISLPAIEPARQARLAVRTHDYVGTPSAAAVAFKPTLNDAEAVAGLGVASTAARAETRGASSVTSRPAAAFGSTALVARSHSASGSGFAPGGYGMSGVGAWGGVSGVVQQRLTTRPAAAKAPRPARTPSKSAPRNPRTSGSGGGATATSGSGLLAAGFTTGAAAVDGRAGAVALLQPGKAATPAGPAPAPTPEPMSFLLVGTGLAAAYNVRRYLQ